LSHALPNGPVKVAITRAWTDLAPKLLAFLTGGTAATATVLILHSYFNVDIDPALAAAIVTVAGTILGYFVKDTTVIDPTTVKATSASTLTVK